MVETIPLDSIVVNPRQPRTQFEAASLEELASSIRDNGILQPVLVRPLSDGRYELIAGERRVRACRLAGLREVPALIRRTDDDGSLVLAIVENIQRADLNPLDEAHAYKALMDQFGLTQEDIAQRVGRSRPSIANTLRLLQLSPEIQEEIRMGRMSAGHARALLAVGDQEASASLGREIVTRGLSVREAERAARGARPAGSSKVDPDVARMESDLSRALGTKVKIHHSSPSAGKGQVEVSFYSHDDLARLVAVLAATGRRGTPGTPGRPL